MNRAAILTAGIALLRTAGAVPRPTSGRSSAACRPASPPTIPPCPTPGAKPTTSRGRLRFRAWAGARLSSGTITSSSPPRSAPAPRSLRFPVSTTTRADTDRPPSIGGCCTTWTSPPERSAGSASFGAAFRRIRNISQNSFASETPVTDGELCLRLLRQRRPHCGARHERQDGLDEGASALWHQSQRRLDTDRPPRPFSTRTGCTSSTTTSHSRSSRRSTQRPARKSGEPVARRPATGPRRTSGKTICAPRSSWKAP